MDKTIYILMQENSGFARPIFCCTEEVFNENVFTEFDNSNETFWETLTLSNSVRDNIVSGMHLFSVHTQNFTVNKENPLLHNEGLEELICYVWATTGEDAVRRVREAQAKFLNCIKSQ